ncbi:MAG TPA: DUF1499 domain-containing protein [Burkholderiales bacterium]
MLARTALVLALACGVVAIAAGVGHRQRLWSYRIGFAVLAIAVVGAVASVALALAHLALLWRGAVEGGGVVAAEALVLGLLVAVPPLFLALNATRLPRIHDISTDTDNPPAFVALLAERAGAPNPAEYGGPEIAKRQRQAYPDVRPLRLRVAPSVVFAAALEAARELGWRIVARNDATGRIEATDRTFWFGFVDDVVVRVTGEPDGARVDVRSVSRVGTSDLGTNARRIRVFLKELRRQLDAAR